MNSTPRLVWGVVLVTLGAFGGFLVVHNRSIALALAILLFGLGFIVIPGRRKVFVTPRPFRWIPVAWCVLFFVSNIKTDRFRDAVAAAGGSLSSENRLELITYGLVAVVVVGAWFHFRLGKPGVSVWPLLLWPSYALLSTAWSPIPLFTFARSSQLLIVVSLALFCLGLDRALPGIGQVLVIDSLRVFVTVVTLLSLWGLADQSAWEGERFMWPTGQHPIVVGLFVGAALLIVVGGRSLTRFPLPLQVPIVGLFSLVLILGQNRSVLIATGLALLASLWAVKGRNEVWARYLALPAVLWAALAFALVAGQIFLAYFARGQSGRALTTLTGRTDLWVTALRQLETPSEWFLGFGYGSPRVILARLVDWAGQAHNSLVELMLAIGLIGSAAAIASIVVVGYRCFSASRGDARVVAAVEAGLFAQLVVMGVVESILVSPGVGFSMYCFIYFAACVRAATRFQRQPVNSEESRPVERFSPVAG